MCFVLLLLVVGHSHSPFSVCRCWMAVLSDHCLHDLIFSLAWMENVSREVDLIFRSRFFFSREKDDDDQRNHSLDTMHTHTGIDSSLIIILNY